MRHLSTIASILAWGLLACLAGGADTALAAGRITGTVTDAATGEPLPGANVFILGTSIGAATDLDGRYVIPNAPSGAQTLVVTYVGYRRTERAIEVPDGGSLTVDVALAWEAAEGQEIVITAQAQGQVAAINQQLSSNTITNIVSADRIQELPDVNAAESIGRLPGVAIQRSGGEANKVAIRGLSPKYNTVTVNGVRVPSTSGDDRSVDLSLISSNMLSGIEVRKAITPDQDADAIGGSVDLKLREAPAGLMVDVQGQGGYNRMQDYFGNYKFAGSASNRFFGDDLGVIASFNLDRYDRSADKLSAGYHRGKGSLPGTTEMDVLFLDYRTTREENIERGRVGASLLADYRIPFGKITGNTFFNRLTNDGLHRIHDTNLQSAGHDYFDLEDRRNTTSILTGTLGVEQDWGWLRYDASVARTQSHSDSPEDLTWRFGKEGDVLTGLIDQNTRPIDLDPIIKIDSSLALNSMYVNSFDLRENETSTQLNLQLPFRFGDNVTGYFKTGGKLRWLDRANDQDQYGIGGLQYGGPGSTTHPLACFDQRLPDWNIFNTVRDLGWLPMSMVMSDYTRDNFLNGDYQIGLVARQERMMQLTEAMMSCSRAATDNAFDAYQMQAIGTIGRDYDGVERYQAGYAMAEFNVGRWLTFLPGIRWERDYSRYNGQRFREITSGTNAQAPGDLLDLETERENAFWLPMVHLRVKPTDWLDLRLARTETLTRPDYIQYAPITSIDGYRSFIRANNAGLRPARATNYDAAVSVYANKIGLFTAAYFYKSIDDLIRNVQFNLSDDSTFVAMFSQEFAGTNVPASWYTNATPILSTYINDPNESTYRGIELDWQTNFWYLPGALKGIVLNVNYTYITSKTTYQGYYTRDGDIIVRRRPLVYNKVLEDTLATGRMPDQPEHIANVTLGYDLKGFSARLSFLYQTNRSTYVNPLNPLVNGYSGDYFRVDMTLRQKFGNGLELFANLNNLNNRPDENFTSSPGDHNHPQYIEYYGFTMDLGARYRF